ncbi:MAG TPA: PAS domain S-box protein [Candidatus Methylomirabilis sp.]|nr:PAS domain S-box protein [Candidatus Methylomirabilis sp.]
MGILKALLGSGGFQPHGFCYQWNTGLVWLNVLSDLFIGLAYFAIPFILLKFIRKRKDLPFSWMFGLFGLFIVACGSTHLMEVWNLWHAQYWLAGAIKAVTAAASVPTAILLARITPQALELPSSRQWIQLNAALQDEVRERREMEVNLRISEANSRETADLLELTHDAIFVRNLQAEVVYWNRAAEKLYGWSRQEALGKTSPELLHTVFPMALEEIERTILTSGFWEGELQQHNRAGDKLIVTSRWALRTDSAGKPVSILETNRDITQRRREEGKFRALLEAAPDAMIIVDQKGCIQLVNAQVEAVFGYAKSELLGQSVEILVPERFQGKHQGHRQNFFRAPKTREMGAGLELYGVRKDRTEFPVEISLSPFKDVHGLVVTAAIRDISNRKKAEAQLDQQRMELIRSNAELNAANRELEAFSYSVSHDLRAPLRSIDGFSLALLEDYSDKLDAEGKKNLERVRVATQRMGILIDDLLSLSRVTRSAMKLERIDLSVVASDVADKLKESQPGRRIYLRIQEGLEATGDAHLLRIALENLLDNAWKFTAKRPSAHIEFGESRDNGSTAYFVRDDGAGFDATYAERLFGAFQRLHSASEFPGTGIGLATVQRIIHRHGGRIWAKGVAGQGATFYFTLPETKA